MSRLPLLPPMAPGTARPTTFGEGGERPVLWRSWLLEPERTPGGDVTPLLTGLFGFPWRQSAIEAKCTQRDRAVDGFAMTPHVDRHHRVVPDLACTCGIYAGRDELVKERIPPPLRGQPVVTGFVELSGRIVAGRDVYRAERAVIVGPLTMSLGRPSWGAVLTARLGGAPRPTRVITERTEYRVSWAKGRTGIPAHDWLKQTAAALTERYGVAVVPGGTIGS